MTHPLIKASIIALLSLTSTLSSITYGNEKCDANCVLKSAANDQSCSIESTPLVRCGNFEEFKSYDKKLNQSYKSLRKTLNETDRNDLRKTQTNWITWRDKTCDDLESEANCDNGMCVGVAHDSCIVTLTQRRHDELELFKKNVTKAKALNFSFSKKRPDEEIFELP